MADEDTAVIHRRRRDEAIARLRVADVRRLEFPDLMQAGHACRIRKGARVRLLACARRIMAVGRPLTRAATVPDHESEERQDPGDAQCTHDAVSSTAAVIFQACVTYR